MAADVLATQGAKASTATVVTYFFFWYSSFSTKRVNIYNNLIENFPVIGSVFNIIYCKGRMKLNLVTELMELSGKFVDL